MRRALLSSATALLGLAALTLIVQFLGAPVRSETLQRGIEHHPFGDASEPSGAVEGRVIDRRGEPLRDVRVLVTTPEGIKQFRLRQRRGPEQVLSETESGADGSFRLEGLEPGEVRIWAGGGRWLYAPSHVVEVVGGHAASGVEITVEPRPPKQ